MFGAVVQVFDVFFGAWTIFARYGGPLVFVVAGCVLQAPLLIRFALYEATGG